MALLMLISIVLSLSSSVVMSCPSICHCTSYYFVDCRNRALVVIPTNIPHDTKVLAFQNNAITALRSGAFRGLHSLRELYLQENSITSIEAGAFTGLFNLSTLSINYNAITYIASEAFVGLHKLRALRLAGNNLTSISKGAFRNLSHGIRIELDNNPWKCDCGIKWLQYLLHTGDIARDQFGQYLLVSCNTPAVHASKQLIDIPPRDLVCPPEIQTDTVELYLEVRNGNRIEMVCPAIGDPSPDFFWSSTAHQKIIPTNDIQHDLNGTLTIEHVAESDAGNYTCTVTNSAGSDRIMYQLRIVQSTTPDIILPLSIVIGGLLLIIIGILTWIVIRLCWRHRAKRERESAQQSDGNTIQSYDQFLTTPTQDELYDTISDAGRPPQQENYDTIDDACFHPQQENLKMTLQNYDTIDDPGCPPQQEDLEMTLQNYDTIDDAGCPPQQEDLEITLQSYDQFLTTPTQHDTIDDPGCPPQQEDLEMTLQSYDQFLATPTRHDTIDDAGCPEMTLQSYDQFLTTPTQHDTIDDAGCPPQQQELYLEIIP